MLSERSAVVLIQKISKRFGLSEMLTDASRDRVFLVSFVVAALGFERICFIPVNIDSNKSNKE